MTEVAVDDVDQAPTPLITLDDDSRFEVHEKGAEILRGIKGNIGVVCIAGLYRTGKSFILNKLLGYDNGIPSRLLLFLFCLCFSARADTDRLCVSFFACLMLFSALSSLLSILFSFVFFLLLECNLRLAFGSSVSSAMLLLSFDGSGASWYNLVEYIRSHPVFPYKPRWPPLMRLASSSMR